MAQDWYSFQGLLSSVLAGSNSTVLLSCYCRGSRFPYGSGVIQCNTHRKIPFQGDELASTYQKFLSVLGAKPGYQVFEPYPSWVIYKSFVEAEERSWTRLPAMLAVRSAVLVPCRSLRSTGPGLEGRVNPWQSDPAMQSSNSECLEKSQRASHILIEGLCNFVHLCHGHRVFR